MDDYVNLRMLPKDVQRVLLDEVKTDFDIILSPGMVVTDTLYIGYYFGNPKLRASGMRHQHPGWTNARMDEYINTCVLLYNLNDSTRSPYNQWSWAWNRTNGITRLTALTNKEPITLAVGDYVCYAEFVEELTDMTLADRSARDLSDDTKAFQVLDIVSESYFFYLVKVFISGCNWLLPVSKGTGIFDKPGALYKCEVYEGTDRPIIDDCVLVHRLSTLEDYGYLDRVPCE